MNSFTGGRQRSSGVEQRTHKPRVTGSNPVAGTIQHRWLRRCICFDHEPAVTITARRRIFPDGSNNMRADTRPPLTKTVRDNSPPVVSLNPSRKHASRKEYLSVGRILNVRLHGFSGRATPTSDVGVGRGFNSLLWHHFISRSLWGDDQPEELLASAGRHQHGGDIARRHGRLGHCKPGGTRDNIGGGLQLEKRGRAGPGNL